MTRKHPTRAEHNAAIAIHGLMALSLIAAYIAACRTVWLAIVAGGPMPSSLLGGMGLLTSILLAGFGTLVVVVALWLFAIEPLWKWLEWAAETPPADEGDDFE